MSSAQEIIDGLVRRGLPVHIAHGIAANMFAESGYSTDINEAAPVVPGSRGGYGLNQWTGPRRRAFEAEAARRGVPVSDLNFQLDYTMSELQGSERRAYDALLETSDAVEAARVYSEQFLRPGIPHMDTRLGEAVRLSGGGYTTTGGRNALADVAPQPTQPQQAQQGGNAFASVQQPQGGGQNAMRTYMLDPSAFMAQGYQPQPVDFSPRRFSRG